MTRTIALLLITAIGLSACGRVSTLQHVKGQRAVPVASGASNAETADQLIEPSTQSRPSRNVDILTRSEKRADDPFDLPPGPDNGRQR